jgi:hypothetical protein
MYRQLRNQGGIMDVMPRQQYGFGDVVKKITGGVKKAAGAVGDFLGSAVNKVDLADIGSIAALASGNPQLAASFQTMGGGTGNKYLDAGLQLYSGFNQGYNSPQPGGAFGMPQGGIGDLNQYLKLGQLYDPSGYEFEKQPDYEKRGIGGGTNWTDILTSIGNVGTRVIEGILGKDLEKAGATAAGGTAAYLTYQDQKRINEQMQKAYEQFKAGEAKKYEQYRTGEGLPTLTVTGRDRTKEDVVARPGVMGGGVMDLDIRTNPQGVQEIDYRQKGGFVPPIGIKEKADDIPAMLSNNEFVFTADAVRGAGNGDVQEGARKMYAMMKEYEGNA